MKKKQESVDTKQLRSFGLLVGGIFLLLGFGPLITGKELRLWAAIPGAALIALAVILPRSLSLVHRIWMKIGHVLGWINTRIILSIVFYGLFVPIGFFMRLRGRDPMRRNYDTEAKSYRIPSTARPGSHMLRQF
jgi:hypothetical protein